MDGATSWGIVIDTGVATLAERLGRISERTVIPCAQRTPPHPEA
jgi:hypothetical protein